MKPCFNESSLQLVRALCRAFLQEIALFPVEIIAYASYKASYKEVGPPH